MSGPGDVFVENLEAAARHLAAAIEATEPNDAIALCRRAMRRLEAAERVAFAWADMNDAARTRRGSAAAEAKP